MVMLSRAFCDAQLREAVGSIAIESAYLERFIETMLYALTKLKRDMGYPIVEAGMIGSKIDLLTQVGKVKLAKRKRRLKQFTELISNIKQANTDRVTAVHGLWLPEHHNYLRMITLGQSKIPARASKRNKDGTPDTTLDEGRAAKIAERISQLHQELHDFAEQAWPRVFPIYRPLMLPPPPGQSQTGTRKGASRRGSPQHQ